MAKDFAFLATMLGESAVWRPDKPTPTGHEVLADPRYALYLAGWPRQGDYGVVAEQDGPLGAAWYRTFSVNDRNPARRLYESVGFEYAEKHGRSWTMIRRAARSD